jgi:hypothetical protein
MQSNFENLIQKGARPIQSQLLGQHYAQHNFQRIDMEHYLESWKKWLAHSKSKTLVGLEEFKHGDYTQGTTQTFDQFILRHTNSGISGRIPISCLCIKKNKIRNNRRPKSIAK